MNLLEKLRERRQRKARKRHEREKALRERQRAGRGPEDVANQVKGGTGSGFPTGGGGF